MINNSKILKTIAQKLGNTCLVMGVDVNNRLVISNAGTFCIDILKLNKISMPYTRKSKTKNQIIEFLFHYVTTPAIHSIVAFEIEYENEKYKLTIKINEQKQYLVEIQKADNCIYKNQFNELFDATNDGIIIVDNNYSLIDCNYSFLRITKFKYSSQIKSKYITEFIESINQPIIDKIENSICSNGSFTDFECEIKDSNSKSIPIVLSIFKRTDEADNVIGRLIIIKDNTERFKRLSDIESIANIYTTIFNSINDALVIIDYTTSKIDEANQKALDMFGYSREDLFNLTVDNVSDGNPPYSPYESQKHFLQALDYGEANFEWLAKHKSGRSFWIFCYLKTIQINNKKRILAVISDISAKNDSV
jgi:PAS domain S-box-containing protein